MSLSDARSRASLGAFCLDQHVPGWYEWIDPERIEVPAVQKKGSASASVDVILAMLSLQKFPVEYGLQALGDCEVLTEQDAEFLTEAWSEEVERRQKKMKKSRPRVHSAGVFR